MNLAETDSVSAVIVPIADALFAMRMRPAAKKLSGSDSMVTAPRDCAFDSHQFVPSEGKNYGRVMKLWDLGISLDRDDYAECDHTTSAVFTVYLYLFFCRESKNSS